MLNGDDKRTTIKMGSRLTDLISKKKKTNCTCSSLFLLMISKKQIFPCRCFARLQRCFVWLKRQTSIVTHYFYGGTFVCAYPIFCFLCSCSLLFFTAAHFLNFQVFFLRKSSPLFSSLRGWRYCVGARLKFWQRSRVPKKRSRDEAVFLAASPLVTAPPSNLTRLYYNGSAAKSHSTTTQYRQLRRLLFSRTRSSSFSIFHDSVNIKNRAEKDTTLLLFFLSGRPCDFLPNKTLSCTCWLSYFKLVCLWCGRTVARSVYGHAINKFSGIGSLPQFLSYGAPRVELRY